MRNLKRVLSLALALVMMLGMMIVGASAASAKDFVDADEINYTEAVDVLTGLGILEGDEKGSFNPTNVLTREQAAKIICYIIMGEENAEKLGTNTQIFADVAAGRWSAGYIAYCANLGILAGYGNGYFGPEDQLTGVQFGKLLLVAAGYNAETAGYLGNDWATNIATDMIANAIDVKGTVLSNPLTREQAAQMVLQTLDIDTVRYETGNVIGLVGPYTTGESFAEKYFPDLEKFEGVVTANEYADLYDTAPLGKNKTVIGDKTYNVSTALTDIGETRRGWALGKEVLFITNPGTDVIYETGAAVSNIAKESGLNVSGAETYLNFGGDDDSYTSDYRIEYVLEFADKDAAAAFEKDYNVDLGGETKLNEVFRVGTTISANDLAIIRGIFYSADYEEDIVIGEVYVGTKSGDDISDDISYRTFYSKYINDDTDYAAVKGNENGNWLKVIDNDGDGKAEYVLKTEFAMTTITDINTKKGTYTLEEDFFDTADNVVDKADIFTADELAEEDVILYTLIDGVYYVDVVTPVVESIDKKGIDYKKETITCGETTYEWSEIDQEAAGYENDISYAKTETSYDLYLDHFGYVRLYTPSAYNRGFVLLLDGYYATDRRTDEYKATIWNLEDDAAEDVVVTGNAAGFIDDAIDTGDKREEGTWLRLNEFDAVYTATKENYISNIAAYTVNEDNEYSLSTVDKAANKIAYSAAEIDTTKISVKDRTLTNTAENSKDIQTTTATQYYFVSTDARKGTFTVYTWVGYNNAPKEATLGTAVRAYAVIHESTTTKYDIADVVVFESNTATTSTLNFVYALNQKLQPSVNRAVSAYAIGYNDEDAIDEVVRQITSLEEWTNVEPSAEDMIKFYTISSRGLATLIDGADYAKNNIYAATVVDDKDVYGRDYVKLTVEGQKGYTYFYPETVPGYYVELSGKTNISLYYDVKDLVADYEIGDRLVIVTDAKGNVEYVISVDESYNAVTRKYNEDTKDDSAVPAITALWQDIADEANAPSVYEDLVARIKNLPATEDELTKLQGEIEAFQETDTYKDLSVKEAAVLDDGLTAIQKALAAITGLTTAQTAAKAALDKAYAELDSRNYDVDNWAKIGANKTALEAAIAAAKAGDAILGEEYDFAAALKEGTLTSAEQAAAAANAKAVADAKAALTAEDVSPIAVDNYEKATVQTAIEDVVNNESVTVAVEVGTPYATGASVTVTLTAGAAVETVTVTVLESVGE